MEEKILLVEDEPGLRFFLRQVLEDAGYPVAAAGCGREALSLLEEHAFALALVDLRLPDMSGLKLIRQVQRQHPDAVIIILTAYATLESAIEALRWDVCDYLLKPISLENLRASVERSLLHYRRQREQGELLSHIEESSRRLLQVLGKEADAEPTSPAEPRHRQVGDLALDEKGYSAWWKDRNLSLTPTEFALLSILAQRAGEVISCAEMVQQVHGYDVPEPYGRSLIKRHIYYLRQKIEANPAHPRHLINVRGRGYKFVP